MYAIHVNYDLKLFVSIEAPSSHCNGKHEFMITYILGMTMTYLFIAEHKKKSKSSTTMILSVALECIPSFMVTESTETKNKYDKTMNITETEIYEFPITSFFGYILVIFLLLEFHGCL